MKDILNKLKNNSLFIANKPFVKNPYLFAAFGLVLITVTQIISQFLIKILFNMENYPQNTLKGAYIVLAFSYGVSSLILFAYIKFKDKAPISSLGFGNKNRFKKFFLGFALGAAMIIIGTIILVLTGSVKIVTISFTPLTFIYVLLMLPAWLIQSSSEEIWFRGFYMNRIGSQKPILAVSLTCIFFALGHVSNSGATILSTINILLFALFAAIYTMSTEDLFGICGWHTAWNFFQGNVLGFAVSGNRAGPSTLIEIESLKPAWISGGDFGIEGGIICTIMFVIAIIIVLSLKSKNKINL